jgi:copper chaperone CopZ
MPTYHITQMHCPNCAAHVTRVIHAQAADADVLVDLPTQQVKVTGVELDEALLGSQLEKEGYTLHGRVED